MRGTVDRNVIFWCQVHVKFIQKIIMEILHDGLLDIKIVVHEGLLMRNLKLKYLDMLLTVFMSFHEKTLIYYNGNRGNSFGKFFCRIK